MNYRFVLVLVVLFALLTVLPASAALYDQMGNKHWCNSDSYGCWISGENGAHEYIMFWSEDARAEIMGPDSDAPLGIALTNGSERQEIQLKTPAPQSASDSIDVCAEAWEICEELGGSCGAYGDDGECLCPCNG